MRVYSRTRVKHGMPVDVRENWFSLSIMWVLGTELKLSSTFVC